MDAAASPPPRVPPAHGATPAMAQWFAMKAEHPDALLFFRMGDFYELFFADAEAAVGRARHRAHAIGASTRGQPIPMCGVPVHAAESYLVPPDPARLPRRGRRADGEPEDPRRQGARSGARWSGSSRPGPSPRMRCLRPGRPNLLLALAQDRDDFGAAWLDVSTGLFETGRPPLIGAGRACSAGWIRPRSWRLRRSILPTGRAGRAPESNAAAATGGASPLGRSLRRREPRRFRRLHRCRSGGGRDGARLCADHAGGRRCRASPAPRRRAARACWRWTPRRGRASRSCADEMAAPITRCSPRSSAR